MINSLDFTDITKKLRRFFDKKGWVEVYTQNTLHLLSVHEDTNILSNFNYDGMIWPLPQTAKITLDYELLKHSDWKGVFCLSTCFKNSSDQLDTSDNKIVPMYEFIMRGNMEDLIHIEAELLHYLGLGEIDQFVYKKYSTLLEKYDINELNNKLIYDDIGSVVFLKEYPNDNSTFWNTKLATNKLTLKNINVIINGIKVIHSAEMSVNKEDMREQFNKMNNKNYTNILFSNYGKERVEKEVEDYLKLDFFTRAGGYIDITKFINIMKLNNLLHKPLLCDIEQKILEKKHLEEATLEHELLKKTKRNRCWSLPVSSKRNTKLVNSVARVASKAGAKAFEMAGDALI